MKVLAVAGLVIFVVLGNLALPSPGHADVVAYDVHAGTVGNQCRGGSPGLEVDTLQTVWSPGAMVNGGPIGSRDAGTFAMIPIPASILLLGSGLLGLGLIGWRRRS